MSSTLDPTGNPYDTSGTAPSETSAPRGHTERLARTSSRPRSRARGHTTRRTPVHNENIDETIDLRLRDLLDATTTRRLIALAYMVDARLDVLVERAVSNYLDAANTALGLNR
jgi:hypothetical protein